LYARFGIVGEDAPDREEELAPAGGDGEVGIAAA
jgi:hypothetical protein